MAKTLYICKNYCLVLMKKNLLILSLMAAMIAAPRYMNAAGLTMPGIEQLADDEVTLSVNGQSVTVTGAQGMTLEVVSLTGRRIKTIKIENPSQRVELNIPKGCYILKVGKVVRKVSIL